MKQRRKTLKTNAALYIRTSPVILLVSFAYVALSYLISFLQYRISGMDAYYTKIMEA